MKHKTAHPSELLQKEEIDLICITETLLGGNDTVCLSVTPAAHVVLHHPCTTGQRGGMAIIFHESFYFCKLLAQPITGIDHKLHTLRTKDRSGILLVTRNLVMGDSAFMPRLPHSSPGLLTALVSQMVIGPRYETDHTLDLLFYIFERSFGSEAGDLSWTMVWPLST